MADKWNERYAAEEYVYGTDPNIFFKTQIDKLTPGKILMAAEGEGRNAVYAAGLGWEVTAFDGSREGKKKADKLAAANGVTIDYRVGEFSDLEFEPDTYDALGLIFAHFGADRKVDYLRRLAKYLKPGGVVIFEAYDKMQVQYREQGKSRGGPPDVDVMYTVDEVKRIFKGLDILSLQAENVELQEGKLHTGISRVVRLVGRRPIA